MAVSQLEFGGALVLGIGPALLLLYISLRRFDRPRTEYTLFDDRRVFFALAVGLVFGVLVSGLEVSLGTAAYDFASSVLVLVAGLFVEELFKLVYLNRKGYRGRFDTTFYGVAIGGGAAATSVVATVIWAALPGLRATVGPDLVLSMLGLLLFSASLNLVNADTGALIGFGASRGDMMGSFLKALGVRYGHGLLLFAFLLRAPAAWGLLSVATSLAFAGIVYHYVYTQILPGTLPEDIRRGMRRERRARAVKE